MMKGWQKDKTNGFCQTYAMMGYLKAKGIIEVEFHRGDFVYNAIALSLLNCVVVIAKIWSEVCKNHQKNIWWNQWKLNASELAEDINSILEHQEKYQADGLISYWLTDESTFPFE